ncbi:MAG: VapC toxin family PIN domain ribonuclease [Bacteroidetes bacterium QS_9_68_14]|nr:MAG: VapC toxin family PIN domain ribonuclease [Bacteroidetes bacterium QS_9_68_14]
MTYGFDTGFFYRLLDNPDAEAHVREIWAEVLHGTATGVLSFLVCFELYRHGLRGSLPREQTETLVADLPKACRVTPVSSLARCERTARLAHGNGLSMADAFILEAALDHRAERIYTTDADMQRYEGDDLEIVLL